MNDEYKAICTVLFQIREEDSSKKKRPNHMYGFLYGKFPEQYSIPTESEIHSLISLFRKQKAKQSDKINNHDNDNENDYDHETNSVPKEFVKYIRKEIEKAIETETLDVLKPSHVLERAKEYSR